jgi:hypothetical protein
MRDSPHPSSTAASSPNRLNRRRIKQLRRYRFSLLSELLHNLIYNLAPAAYHSPASTMIVVRIGKDHSHATSQQLADGCLSRTAHAHQHDDHAHPKKIGLICRSNRFAVKFFATIFQWQPIDRPRILHHRQKLVRTGKRSLAKCMLKQLTSTLWRTDVLPSESAHIVCSSS